MSSTPTPQPDSTPATISAPSGGAAIPAAPGYAFFTELARIINAGQSRSITLCGNVHDLFFVPQENSRGDYLPLVNFLCQKCQVPGLMLLVYELNGPIRVADPAHSDRLKAAWIAWKTGMTHEQLVLKGLSDKNQAREREMLEAEFDRNLRDAIGQPTVALEFLRQLTICSRATAAGGKSFLAENLLIIIEAADLLLPAGDGDISHLSPLDRHRVGVVQDWFSDPGFMSGRDSVVLLAESRSQVHPRVSRLPAVLAVDVAAPDQAAREHYIQWFMSTPSPTGELQVVTPPPAPPRLWAGQAELARYTAGLSVHALRQLLLGAAHAGGQLTPNTVIAKVEEYIAAQLGEDVVEFKKPTHTFDDIVGFTRLKAFIREELLPRFRSSGSDALPGAAVAGPIGGGKTFIFEAVASSLDLPVLVLKNIRSQWYGQTDVIFERLRRVLEALVKVVIVVDEADTQFGGVGPEEHSTERRLTGKVQQMMSDPKLRGRVIWLLMTARIHLLSPDIRRPGRVGDLIIPVLDPEGDDRREFLRWMLTGALAGTPDEVTLARIDPLTAGYSAAAFASLRSHLKAKAAASPLTVEVIEQIIHDHIPPAIESTRRYQTLQALVNCTRRSLLPDPNVDTSVRESWQTEIRRLEALGVR